MFLIEGAMIQVRIISFQIVEKKRTNYYFFLEMSFSSILLNLIFFLAIKRVKFPFHRGMDSPAIIVLASEREAFSRLCSKIDKRKKREEFKTRIFLAELFHYRNGV